MSRTRHPMRTLARTLGAAAALAAAGPVLAHPGHLNTSLFTDFAHYLEHLAGDAGPLLAALPLVLLGGWLLRRRGGNGRHDASRRNGR